VGADETILYQMIKGVWISLSTTISLILIIKYFNPVNQGYYFTFLSLIFLQNFAELGLSFAIYQFISHEMADLNLDNKFYLNGGKKALDRINSILNFSYGWFGTSGCIFIAVAIPLGMNILKLTGIINN
jgi:hypothetical protein